MYMHSASCMLCQMVTSRLIFTPLFSIQAGNERGTGVSVTEEREWKGKGKGMILIILIHSISSVSSGAGVFKHVKNRRRRGPDSGKKRDDLKSTCIAVFLLARYSSSP